MTLGNFATKLLLRTEVGITRMRGQTYPWWLGATLVPTFHPAAALRGGERVKSQMIEDFELVREVLASPPSQRSEDSEAPPEMDEAQMELFG